jgi:hypothetical protein
LAIETLYLISPVGSNNKVFPVGHTYWDTCDAGLAWRDPPPEQGDDPSCHLEQQVLLAPGPGIARWVNPVEDGAVRVSGPGGHDWQMGHVTPLVAEGDTIAAGQPVAKMLYRHGFDFGVWQMKDSISLRAPSSEPGWEDLVGPARLSRPGRFRRSRVIVSGMVSPCPPM